VDAGLLSRISTGKGVRVMLNPGEQLRARAQRHTVRYEIGPHWEVHERRRVVVGFDLELHGTHDHGHSGQTPGCLACQETFADLRAIAEAVIPAEARPSVCEIEPFDRSLHSEGRGPSEVVLVIRLMHRVDYFSPPDACEDRCLADMEAALKEIGIGGRKRH
jgi:hypothetical protein